MKKITIILLLFVLFSSCENMLEEVPKSFVSRTNYYQNESDAEGAIVGAYSALRTDFYGITYYLMVELHGDFLEGRGSQAPISLFNQILDQRNINRAASNWSTLYSAINRTNAVLDNVAKIEDISQEAKTRILAEAHFLRALAYFNLVRGWGAVPIKTSESVDLSTVSSPREPESKVYELIIQDAIAAESGLPEVGDETGRASKWAAKMLLAHVYLTLENWGLAAEKANDVITGGPYSLVTVSKPDDFYKIFATETNSEDIMSLHHSETRESSIQTFIHRGKAYPYNYKSRGYFAWLPKMNSFIGYSWDDNDLRKKFNLYTKYQNADGEWVSLPESYPVLFKKFITDPNGISLYSIPIYRFTEAFLFYAEASCMAEGSPSQLALERLNMIKRRAYGYDPAVASPVDYPAGMSKEDFRDAVLKERGYEFILERRRWWDLKRTNRVREAMQAVGKTFINERLLWPIAEDEINNNPAINQEDQNPGY
ncbi:Cell surface glycan-binding lipoprotein, utilization system for glycans and polysaccharides (PUL), SusD family [hydrothermal vent metagenome]|uniref:Cell surface glycan-binding lipoprotein, utilization system for glycans and polysaccharides (PUL), SusD family n=1 Tax=hydrothermal vent metagenome TaxID=652676 RepID=A0A3B0UXC8_9ZZZZ